MWDEVRKWSEKGVDGYNISPNLLGPGLQLQYPDVNNNESNNQPPTIINQLVPLPPGPNPPPPPPPNPPPGPNGPGCLPKLESDGTPSGMEIWVKAGKPNGKLCIVDSGDLTNPQRQLFSGIPDASSNTNPGTQLQTPLGPLTLNAVVGNLNLQTANTNRLVLDSNNATFSVGLVLSGNIVPSNTNTYDLGSISKAWKDVFTRIVDTDGANNLILKRNAITNLTLDGTNVASSVDIVPITNVSNSLGTNALTWKNLYIRTIDTDAGQNLILRRGGNLNITLDGTNASFSVPPVPATTNIQNLGTTTLAWRTTYTRNIDTDGDQSFALKRNTITYISIAAAGTTVSYNQIHDFNGGILKHKRGVIVDVPALSAGEIYIPTDVAGIPEIVVGVGS